MKRLQVMIEEELYDALARRARREHTSKAALVRRYVQDGLQKRPSIESDPLWEIVGAVEGAPEDSTAVDRVVYT